MLIRFFIIKLLIDVLLLTTLFTSANNDQIRLQKGKKLYFAIATSTSDQSYSRTFNKTLANMTQTLFAGKHNVTLDTLILELPNNGTFSAILLEMICNKFEGKHVVAMLIVGDSPAAFTVSLAATYSGIPVLWAQDEDFYPAFHGTNSKSIEVRLTPTGRETVQALRGILLQAHWHTFTVLADRSSVNMLQQTDVWKYLITPPLHPTMVSFSYPDNKNIIRKLAEISTSTRGVVVIWSSRNTAKKILESAKRLNMLDGHFVWIWIDTQQGSINNFSFMNNISTYNDPTNHVNLEKLRFKREMREESSEMNLHYLLKNDIFLLFNNPDKGYKSSKIRKPVYDGERVLHKEEKNESTNLPQGLLSLRPLSIKIDKHFIKGAVRLLIVTLKIIFEREPFWIKSNIFMDEFTKSCWKSLDINLQKFSLMFGRELRRLCKNALGGAQLSQEIGVDKVDKSLVSNFELLNLVYENIIKDPETVHNATVNKLSSNGMYWKRIGTVAGKSVKLDTIVWPGGDLSVAAISSRPRTVFRIVTALAPPFVMESDLDDDDQCLRGLLCHRVLTSDKDNLTLVFNDMEYKQKLEDIDQNEGRRTSYNQLRDDNLFQYNHFQYQSKCCYGLSMDLLKNIAQDLQFDFNLYIVVDGLFGSKIITKNTKSKRETEKHILQYKASKDTYSYLHKISNMKSTDYVITHKWNGVVGDLLSGAAHMAFAPLSVSSARSQVIDFSIPYFYSGVSFIAAPQQKSEIPLLAFLLPFSTELWIAIFTSLNITAIAVAIYEWLSPFGLNPWGRQRSKNFSMSSALWVMWGLLCGHLVAFKAPKSWPNKFLINVWGGFSVIFVASYTANIAALIAGLFFHNTVSNYHDRSLLSQRVGAPRSSASEYYVQKANRLLWEHMYKFTLANIEEGIERLRNGSLDILIADTPILDYYRATDHGCKLQRIGDTINEDTYAIGMTKGFPLKDSISAVIAKYSNNGYMDILQEKWYGGLPCFTLPTEMAQPRPLGVAAVTGVFILLGLGMVMGLLILIVEHAFFRYTLPMLRDKPKGSVWRSRNIMFFSQKLYRFINCVELVSPHHAARELVHTIRQGQITSLFQKSIKRKEHEQRRRRKSKAQFFEMIQEIRRQQQEGREQPLESVTEDDSELQYAPDVKNKLSPSIIRQTFMRTSPKLESTAKGSKSPTYLNKYLFSPRSINKARVNLNIRRFSTDSVLELQTYKSGRNAIGRRLSKDASAFLSNSPPDINSRRSSYLDIVNTENKLSGKSPVLSIENVSNCDALERKLSDSESIGKKLATLPRYGESSAKLLLQTKTKFNPKENNLSIVNKTIPKSCTNITEYNKEELVENKFDLEQKSNLSDDEIAQRNRITIEQLQIKLNNKPITLQTGTWKDNNSNPQIRIHVEDTSKILITPRKYKRHKSLSDNKHTESSKSHNLGVHSRSLDGNQPIEESKLFSKCKEHNLPPAPPPPNCSPRNSNGRSPLERLSKDELVLLWRSSESELRSHLLKAIRDKEKTTDPP